MQHLSQLIESTVANLDDEQVKESLRNFSLKTNNTRVFLNHLPDYSFESTCRSYLKALMRLSLFIDSECSKEVGTSLGYSFTEEF